MILLPLTVAVLVLLYFVTFCSKIIQNETEGVEECMLVKSGELCVQEP